MIKIEHEIKNLYLPHSAIKAKDERHQIIKKIAITSLKELAIGLAFAGLTCAFCSTPIGMALALGSVVAMVALNILCRYMAADATQELRLIEAKNDPGLEKRKKSLQVVIKICNFICPFNLASVYTNTAGILVHEAGHACVASILTKGPISISVSPWQSGVTKYFLGKLSSIGQALGLRKVGLLIAAAGALFTLTASVIVLIVGHCLKHAHPQVATCLNMIAILGILREALYALEALSSDNSSSQDFGNLAQGGIHPLVSIAILIGLPLLVKAMMLLIDHIRKHTPIPILPLPI